MKIWVLLKSVQWEHEWITSVWLTKQQAEAELVRIQALPTTHLDYDHMRVEEHEVQE